MRRPRQIGLRATAGLTLALLAGCATFKVTYDNLDWVARWQVGRFVDLEPPQKTLFDTRFREFWSWHRTTQLRLYVQDIRELMEQVDKPLAPAQIEAYMQRSQTHVARTLQNAVPDTAAILKTLDDAQVQELQENLAAKRAKDLKESADLTPEELIERSEEMMLKNLKRWIGTPNRDQRRRVERWARERWYAGTVVAQYREAWAAAFSSVLAHRTAPDFARQLALLFDNGKTPFGAEMERVRLHNRQLLVGTLADLSATLTPQQRRHLREKLAELATDLEELARSGTSAPR